MLLLKGEFTMHKSQMHTSYPYSYVHLVYISSWSLQFYNFQKLEILMLMFSAVIARASAMLLPTPYKCVSMVIVFLTNTLRAKCNFDLRSEVLLMWWAFRSCYYDILTRSQFLTICRTCIEANITCSIS